MKIVFNVYKENNEVISFSEEITRRLFSAWMNKNFEDTFFNTIKDNEIISIEIDDSIKNWYTNIKEEIKNNLLFQ